MFTSYRFGAERDTLGKTAMSSSPAAQKTIKWLAMPLGVLTILAPLACAHIEAPTTAPPSVANPTAAHPRSAAREVVPMADSGSSLPQAPKPLGTDPGSSARDARTATPVESAHPEAADPPIVYPLVVSFGSACCGTNRDAARTLERLLDAYLPEALGLERVSWGEEGEYDLCFTLAGLAPKQRLSLVNDVKTRIRHKLVSVRQNEPCYSKQPLR